MWSKTRPKNILSYTTQRRFFANIFYNCLFFYSFRQDNCPRVHLAPVASGRQVVRDDQLRQQFIAKAGALAFDCEFDAVIESILGNCKDSFVCIRGISDYKDGTRQKDWQPYASLVAASFMKAIICGMEPPANV